MNEQTSLKSPIVTEYDYRVQERQYRFDKAEDRRRRTSSLKAHKDKKTLWRKLD